MASWEIIIDGNSFTTIATCIGAAAAVYAACIARKIGKAANQIAQYEVNRKIVQEIYDLFEEAKSKFYVQEPYKYSEPEILIVKAFNKAKLFGFLEISDHLDNIRNNLLSGHEAYSLQSTQNEREHTEVVFKKKKELGSLFSDISSFEKIFKI